MKSFTKIAAGFFTVSAFFLLKFWYAKTTSEDVLFLLKPIAKLVNIITGSEAVFQSEIGYVNENLNIIINKSCSGFNFLMIVFLMLSFLLHKFFKPGYFQFLISPVVLVFSYGFTIVVNVSRILLSVVVNRFVKPGGLIHQFEGTFVYMSFLMLLYLGVDYLLKQTKYEEFA